MNTLPEPRQVAHIEQPKCESCRHRHRPDLPCWRPPYSAALTFELLNLSRTCWICRGTATTADHYQPRAFGGGDELENLRPACLPCNRARGTRSNPFRAEDPTPAAGVPLSERWRAHPR
jgi:5-methylcytosine-specific restriction endonuclease McrA